ncbi:MAG: outer membrane beta-barrel protein [Bacteroidales bacterium]
MISYSKIVSVVLLLLSGLVTQIYAQNTIEQENRKSLFKGSFRFSPVVGVDIGGAIPTTLGTIDKVGKEVAPKIVPSIGLRVSYDINSSWRLSTEATYKQVGFKADSKVKDQYTLLIDQTSGARQVVYFTGVADMDMAFTLLEIPLYATWSWNRGRDNILAGVYYAHAFSASFDNTARKGYLSDVKDNPTTEQINPLNEPLVQSFNEVMSNWDIGVVIGYERRILRDFTLGLRVSMGSVDIFQKGQNPLGYEMRHMRGSLNISYDLFSLNLK